MSLIVSKSVVYSLTCSCGAELGNPVDGSLNWPADYPFGNSVYCHDCAKNYKLPKALRSFDRLETIIES